MAKNHKQPMITFQYSEALVAQRVAFASSGAVGTHQNQRARAHRTGSTNRIDSRSARLLAATHNTGW